MNIETDEELNIKEEAAGMAATFLLESKKPPRKSQWQGEYKERTMELLWRCNLNKYPPPIDLVMLIGCLFGKRHDWPVAKFAVINELAKKYPPIQSGEAPPKGLKSFVSKIITEYGGILDSARELDEEAGNVSRDYRRTADKWLNESLFLYLWEERYFENHGRSRENSPQILEVIKQELLKLASC